MQTAKVYLCASFTESVRATLSRQNMNARFIARLKTTKLPLWAATGCHVYTLLRSDTRRENRTDSHTDSWKGGKASPWDEGRSPYGSAKGKSKGKDSKGYILCDSSRRHCPEQLSLKFCEHSNGQEQDVFFVTHMYCDVLCWAVLCCAVLCYAMLCCAVPCVCEDYRLRFQKHPFGVNKNLVCVMCVVCICVCLY
jgi:hypothetical protein